MMLLLCQLALAGPEDHLLIDAFLAARELTPSTGADVVLIAADRDPVGGWNAAIDAAAHGRRAVVVIGAEVADMLPPGAVATPARGLLVDRSGAPLVAPWGACTIQGGTGAWATDGDGKPLITVVQTGWESAVVVVCIPHLLDDASLLHPVNAHLVEELLGDLDPRHGVRFVDAGSPSGDDAYAALKAVGLLPFMLHLSAWFCVAGLAWGRSFAAPRDPVTTQRRDFAAHLAAVAALYRRVQASRHVAGAYAAWQLARVRTRHGVGTDAAIAATIARKRGQDPAVVEAALAAARSAATIDALDATTLPPFCEAVWKIDPHP